MKTDPMTPYYVALFSAWFLLALLIVFRRRPRYPVQDHSWLRHRPGTWVRHRTTLEVNGNSSEELLTVTLREIVGHKYLLEETLTTAGAEPRTVHSVGENGFKARTEPTTVAGRHYQCGVWVAFSRKGRSLSSIRFFVPEGEKDPVGIVFKDPEMQGELAAVASGERMEAMGRSYVCTRLEGKVRRGKASGTMTLWHCRDVPGSQVRMDLVLHGPEGSLKSRTEAIGVHEEAAPAPDPTAPARPSAGP